MRDKVCPVRDDGQECAISVRPAGDAYADKFGGGGF
jgi:hypothetical protein